MFRSKFSRIFLNKFDRKIKPWNKQNIPYKIDSFVQVGSVFYISLEQTNIVSPADKFSHLFYVRIFYLI